MITHKTLTIYIKTNTINSVYRVTRVLAFECLSLGPWGTNEGFQERDVYCESGSSSLFQHSTTLGSVVAGGLGDYGSDESEDEEDGSVRGSESSDTDEEELHHRIREKQDAFRRKEREMFLLQEKQAQDALLARGEM